MGNGFFKLCAWLGNNIFKLSQSPCFVLPGVPSITGAVSGATLYLGGILTCQLTIARPVNYSWTDLTYGNSSIGPQLTVWHGGSYECTALINSSGSLSSSAKAVYDLAVESKFLN